MVLGYKRTCWRYYVNSEGLRGNYEFSRAGCAPEAMFYAMRQVISKIVDGPPQRPKPIEELIAHYTEKVKRCCSEWDLY